MKISIIIPCYNSGKTLQRTIDSITSQDYPKIEVIVVDGGSTDDTINIIKENREIITHYISEKDNGVYDAMNKGIKLCSGDIIGIISSNDWLNEDTLKTIKKIISEDSSIDIIHGNIIKQKVIGSKTYSIVRKGGDPKDLNKSMSIRHPSCFIRSEVYKKNFYDTTYKIAGDFELLLRLKMNRFRFKYIDNEFVVMTDGGLSTTYKTITESYNVLKRAGYRVNASKYLIKRTTLVLRSKLFRCIGKLFLTENKFQEIEIKRWNNQFELKQ